MAVRWEPLLQSIEGLTPTEAGLVIFPHILRFATSAPSPEHARDVAVLVDRTNNLISFIDGRPIIAEPTLEGLLPASKASVEEMPMVKVLDKGIDCSICLLDFKIDEEAKEMPCKHSFHSICIDKWLGINGSCPICRYKMPVDEQCKKKDDESGEDERGNDGDIDMEEDRLISVFHVVIDAINMTISVSEVPRGAYDDVLIRVEDGDLSEARDGGESEARDGDESEAGDDGDNDEFEVRDNGGSEARDGDESEAGDGGDDDESEAQDMVIDNN